MERISVGMQHVAAQASPIDRKTGLPQLGSEFCGLFMWGRGREGQLGVGTHQDNSVPKMVDELKGRRVLQVCASDLLASVVFPKHTVRFFELTSRPCWYCKLEITTFRIASTTVQAAEAYH